MSINKQLKRRDICIDKKKKYNKIAVSKKNSILSNIIILFIIRSILLRI